MRLHEIPEYTAYLDGLETDHKLPKGLLQSIMLAESAGQNDARSPVGARGAFQFMPATAREYGIDPLDPIEAADGAARYLRKSLDRFGNLPEAVASYNAGPGRIARTGVKGAPRETRSYTEKVLNFLVPAAEAAEPVTEDFDAMSTEELLDIAGLPQPAPQRKLGETGRAETAPPLKPQAPAGQAPVPAPLAPTPGAMALEGMPAWERALVGTGKAFSDTWHGIKQLGAEAANAVSPELVSDETVKGLRAEADETRARDEALLADPYGRGGNIGGHVAMGIALPAKRIATAIGSAAGYGAAQPVGTEESRTDNTVASAAFGGAAGVGAKVVGRALKPVRSEVSRGIGNLMNYAESKGFKLSAGQRTGSRHLQNAEAALDTLPTSGSPLGKFRDHNQKVANRIVAKEMGESGDTVTPDVIEGARARIGGIMDSLTNGRHFNADHQFFNDIFRIRAQYGQTLRGQQSAEIRSILNELATGSRLRSPRISASQYQRTASALRQEAEASFRAGTNVNDAQVKRDIAETLEKLAERNFTGEELAAFQQARRQYSATLIAEKAVRPDGSGDIMIERLHQATKKHRRVANRQGGRDDLVMLGRLGQGLKKQLIPNSGTAERSWWLQALQNPIGHAGLGYGALGPAGAVGALSAPWLIGRGMYSNFGQNWLRNGVPNTNLLRGALSRTAPGVASGATASERSAR